MANRTTQISECLNKLYDLMPDAIITYEVSLTFLELSSMLNTTNIYVPFGRRDMTLYRNARIIT